MGINWFSAGINKPNASCLLEPVATAIVMFVLIYCSLSAHCLPKFYKGLASCEGTKHSYDLRICETRGQILMKAILKAEVLNVFCMRYLSTDVLADFS